MTVHPAALVSGLIACRALGVALFAPGWGLPGLGARIRLLLAGMIAVALYPSASRLGAPLPIEANGPRLAMAAVGELLIGGFLGLSGSLIVAGMRQAGELVGLQAGLSPASLLDLEPGAAMDEAATPFGHLFGLVALGTYLAADGPVRLIDALAQSYVTMPMCGDWTGAALNLDQILDLFRQLGAALGLAVQAAAPAGLALVLAGFAMAWLARGATIRTLSGMAWPLRWGLGVALVFLFLPGLAMVATAAWNGAELWVGAIHQQP